MLISTRGSVDQSFEGPLCVCMCRKRSERRRNKSVLLVGKSFTQEVRERGEVQFEG